MFLFSSLVHLFIVSVDFLLKFILFFLHNVTHLVA
ncbi:hypothetical protein BMETH_453_0 [methanotrophic bacterial endosymbiont of Bathymodiolus sp.]|nr:hypothetical protein BMETH_453_0 [methanotrophic bacterial endosymbiont of Bathymodiolus sp.]